MAKLQWDAIGQRFFEAGIDRGVLYLPIDNGVPWNGLTSVTDNLESVTSEPVYFDGVKVLDNPKLGDFDATLNAFTYPDEFLEYEGLQFLGDGMYVDDQTPKQFGLCYRTRVGNDVDGLDHGYRLHLVYNVTATPATPTYETMTNTAAPSEFSWNLTAVPEPIPGFRATAHIILDSRYLEPDILAAIEDILYGTEGSSGDVIYDGGDAMSDDTIDGGYAAYTSPDIIDAETPSDIVIDSETTWIYPDPVINGGDADDIGDPLFDGTIAPTTPRLPFIDELINIITYWGPKLVVPDTAGGLASLVPGEGDLTATSIPGIYSRLADSRLQGTSVDGVYVLVP